MRRTALQATMPHRREGAAETALRLAAWFGALAAIDPSLALWRPVARKKPIPTDAPGLAAMLARSAIKDDDGRPMAGTGWGLILASVQHAHVALQFRVGLPEGPMGDNVWLQLPEGMDSGLNGKVFQNCLKEKVIYVPGEYCHVPDEHGKMEHHSCRLSFGISTDEQIAEGIKRLRRACQGL